MNSLLCAIFIPLLAALFCFVSRRLAKWLALLVTAGILALAVNIFLAGQVFSGLLALRAYPFSAGVFMAAAFFTIMITLYSFGSMDEKENLGPYYAYILMTIGLAAGALFATDFLTLLLFWGALGIPLYLLIGCGGPSATSAAKKSLIMVGGADALMIFGIGIVWALTGTLQIGPAALPLNSVVTVLAFLALATGAFAKAGVMPFHSWVPAAAEGAPATVMALLPASLDKLLGIYLLARLCFDVFDLVPNSAVSNFLLITGSLTIMTAGLAGLAQPNFKKLLSYCAVSQVGYIVLGIGSAIPLGVAGGLFHMFNHAIYKSCLFLCGGAVESSAGTAEMDKLGGLAKLMPLTFAAFSFAALSISGVPPFNGFFSKWMVYQSLIELSSISPYWIIWLAAAMFGSAFTLAGFLKMTYAVFLGQGPSSLTKSKEVPWQMWLPMLTLAAFCVLFGVFAFALPLPYLISPIVGTISYPGFWQPQLATGLLLVALLLGSGVYLIGRIGRGTVKPVFIGGEVLPEEVRVSGVDFYETIRSWGPLAKIYAAAERKKFDLYEQGSRLTFALAGLLSRWHDGLLQTYFTWFLLGAAALLFFFVR